MPPISSSERQKLLLQQEIAKLSGAISRHASGSTHPTFHPYAHSRGHNISRGHNRGRGRGRGGYAIDNRSKMPVDKPIKPTTGPSNKADIVSEREAGEVSPTPTPPSEPLEPVQEDWVKVMSKGGNLSLMTKEKSDHLQSMPKKPRQKRSRIPPHIQTLTSSTTTEGQRVVIDGVIFQFDLGGQKLTRIGEVSPTQNGQSSRDNGTPTRKSVSYAGSKFRRTSRGNLVKSSSRAELSKIPCRYYTKTGRCNRALTCPYAHIPDRLAICPRFLRDTCPNTAATCPLSHNPSPRNTPSCVHFQATSTCRNGSSCLYPHVKVADDAPVCDAFAREGWCDEPPGKCQKLHVWECGEWREKGTCSRGERCGLRHVLRAEKGKRPEAEEGLYTAQKDTRPLPVEGGFDDGSEFINLDQGSPPRLSDAEEDSEESADDSESDSDGSESESDEEEPALTGKHVPSSDGMETDEADEDEVLGVVA